MVDKAITSMYNGDDSYSYHNSPLFTLVKELDDKKRRITDIKQIFSYDIELIRHQIVEQSANNIFQNDEALGKKSCEVLWRKGYYEQVSMAKRMWKKRDEQDEKDLAKLISEGIDVFKSVILGMEEQSASDDIKYLIDFSILRYNNERVVKKHSDSNRECLNGTNYVKATIHASLLSIGDLHRYFIDFQLNKVKFSKEVAAKYYVEAFSLNPNIGMPQNQLGTIFMGRNYDLDSTYHYLYSLMCSTPFDFAEHNVSTIFLNSSKYVCKLEDYKSSDSLHDFTARFILIADIFFFDKNVTDFISLCHSWLLDLRGFFQSKNCIVTKDMLFKFVTTLFFCMAKLKSTQSQKLYSLISLMVAICSEIIEVCISNIEKFIEQHKEQDIRFQETYEMMFQMFKKDVQRARENNKMKTSSQPEVNVQYPTLLRKTITQSKSIVEKVSEVSPIINEMVPSLGSSGREKESDGKSSIASKLKKKHLTRRRRKRIGSDDLLDSDASSDLDSDHEMNSNFSSDIDDDDVDLTSYCSTDIEDNDANIFLSDEDENIENNGDKFKESLGPYDDAQQMNMNFSFVNPMADMFSELTKANYKMNFHLSDDVVVEEEYAHTQCAERNSPAISPETYSVPQSVDPQTNPTTTDSYGSDHQSDQKFEKMRFKREYGRIDPNIIIQYAQSEPFMETLKILFDWLKLNNEILVNCFSSNPEFIHKTMKLMNLLNIDIFTRKVYFERSFIKTQNVRSDLWFLFDSRLTIPLQEDVRLKEFQLLKLAQHSLDWTLRYKLNITENEDHILRIFKLIDFGFFISKMKVFHYSFCPRTRRFTEQLTRKERGLRKNPRRNELNNNNRDNQLVCRNRDSQLRNGNRCQPESFTQSETISNDEKDEPKAFVPKKSYSKNRISVIKMQQSDKENSREETKNELMGKLWLENEVQTLEKIVKKGPVNKFTPYLVVDSMSLTKHLSIVKILCQSKKFVVLIPSAVICELDELKKCGESARSSIRYLEQQFSKGSRFLRAQNNNESLAIPLVKIPKKLDRELSTFVKIAEFCNFLQTKHSENNMKVVTLLTGDSLHSKKSSIISFTGILNAASVSFETITTFHSKYEKK